MIYNWASDGKNIYKIRDYFISNIYGIKNIYHLRNVDNIQFTITNTLINEELTIYVYVDGHIEVLLFKSFLTNKISKINPDDFKNFILSNIRNEKIEKVLND